MRLPRAGAPGRPCVSGVPPRSQVPRCCSSGRLRGSGPARPARRKRQRRRCARPRRDHLGVGGRLALRARRPAAEQPAPVRVDADAGGERLPGHCRLRRGGGRRRPRELVLDEAADRLRVPRDLRLAAGLLGLRLAAQERPDLGRRDVRLRESRRGGRPRHGVPGRDDRLDDDRRRSGHRHCRGADRDGEAALP